MLRSKFHQRNRHWLDCARVLAVALMASALVMFVICGISTEVLHARDLSAARLKVLRADMGSLEDSSAGVNRADAKARLQKILAQREFNQSKGGDSWWSQMWDQIQRWISWLLDHTLGRLLGSGAAKTVAIYVLIGAVFLFAAVWIVRGMRTLARSETLSVEASFPPGKHWRDWTREATAAASCGDYRAALHAAYWDAGFTRPLRPQDPD